MSAKVWYSPSAHGSRFGPSVAFQCWIYCALEGRAPVPRLLYRRSANAVRFSPSWVQQAGACNIGRQNGAVIDRRYRTARVRVLCTTEGFWSTVLEHRFRFGWRADFHVGLRFVAELGEVFVSAGKVLAACSVIPNQKRPLHLGASAVKSRMRSFFDSPRPVIQSSNRILYGNLRG